MERRVLDHGYVRLVDTMGTDADIARAARVSTLGKKSKRSDAGLIDYLMRHGHHSPFEMAELKFEVKAPIFVARQWFRHRTGNYNEISGRYTELPDDIYVPTHWRSQDYYNKQGSSGVLEEDLLRQRYLDLVGRLRKLYEDLLDTGVAREIARAILPVSQYTIFFFKSDLRNLFHFLHLRTDPHAQMEIRVYAEAIEEIVKEKFPVSWESWKRNVKDSVVLSSIEAQALTKALKRYPDIAREVIKDIEQEVEAQGLSKSLIREAKEELG